MPPAIPCWPAARWSSRWPLAAYEFSRARSGGQAVGPTEAVRLMNQGARAGRRPLAGRVRLRPHPRCAARAAGPGRPGRGDAQALQGQGRDHRAAKAACARAQQPGCCRRRDSPRWSTCAAGCRPGAPRTCRSSRRRRQGQVTTVTGHERTAQPRNHDVFDGLVPVLRPRARPAAAQGRRPSARSRSTKTPTSAT